MARSEQDWYGLQGKLEEALGQRYAAALIARISPVPWPDVATKGDLEALSDRMDARFERMNARFEAIEARFEGIDGRFQGIDARFEGIDVKLEGIHERIDRLDETIDSRIEASENHLLATFHRELNLQMRTTVFALAAMASVLVAAIRL